MSYEHEEDSAPIAFAGRRCAGCGLIKPHEADGHCATCLSFKPVPVKAHWPEPLWWAEVVLDSVVVFAGPMQTSAHVDGLMETYGSANVRVEKFREHARRVAVEAAEAVEVS